MSGIVADALTWWARTVPTQTAIDADGDAVGYRELATWADGVAADLRSSGVRHGDRVAIVGANSLEWCVAALGGFKVGAIVVPFNQRMVARELGGLVEDCEPTVVFCDRALRERIEEVRAAHPGFAVKVLEDDVARLRDGDHQPAPGLVVDPDEPTGIVYTSGTTGRPKGVIFTHRSIAGEMHEWHLIDPIQPNGLRPLMVLPLFTAAGFIWGLVRAVLHGGTLLLQPVFQPARALEVLATQRATILNGPPIIFEQIAAQPGFAEADLSALTSANAGGARVSAELLAKWHAKGVALCQMYGQTEIGGFATTMPREEAALHPEQCGWGGIFTKIRVVDETGRDVPAGVQGQILLRGPGMLPGYWRNEEATRAAIRDGWLHTGDIGVLDDRGYLTFVDRMKDMIISGGLNISPMEIEQVLQAMDAVEEVAVISVADDKFGETPAVLLRTSTKISAEDVVAWCNERLADYKVPRYVHFLEEPLPRMASGKIAKRELAQTWATLPQTHPRVR